MESKKIISSPNLFYVDIKDIDISDPIIQKFKDHMFQFLHGCSCSAERNWDKSLEIYKTINSHQIEDTKVKMGFEHLDFYLDSEFLFRV